MSVSLLGTSRARELDALRDESASLKRFDLTMSFDIEHDCDVKHADGGHTMSFLTKLPKQLYDRNAFNGFKNRKEFDVGTGRSLAWLSQLAYETDEPDKIRDMLKAWGMRLVGGLISQDANFTVLPIASTQCFVAAGRGATIITFAGTDPLKLPNWISDFDTRPSATGTAEGYQTASNAVWPQLSALLSNLAPDEKEVFVTGHSLGGALAIITANRIISDRLTDVSAVYTFGMPRPGSADFAASYNKDLGTCTYRLVHGEDLVPTVAPSDIGFHHVGRYLHCDRGGKFDAGKLDKEATSDDPLFTKGVSKELHEIFSKPVLYVLAQAKHLKMVATALLGMNTANIRTDPGGIAIEMLPPRLRDHMPDRYIGGF
jgi:hypothetical protein